MSEEDLIFVLQRWLDEDSLLAQHGYGEQMRLTTLRAVMHWKIKELEREKDND